MQNVHPLVVHFPVALLVIGVVLDIAGVIRRNAALRTVGIYNLAIGMLGAAGAVGTGLWAEASVGHSDEAHAIMETHQLLGLSVLAVAAVLTLWRWRAAKEPVGLVRVGYITLAVLLLGLVTATGHLGGRLVYENGVGMAPGVTAPAAEPAGHTHGGGHDHGAPGEDAALPSSGGAPGSSEAAPSRQDDASADAHGGEPHAHDGGHAAPDRADNTAPARREEHSHGSASHEESHTH